ncbi:MAG: hypothetical protein ACOC8E_02875 [Planctomycetota bacterium]
MRGHGARAFSLTELLAVIALILILVSIILVGGSSVYSYALRTQCQSRMESIWHACRMYANANDGCLPRAWDDAIARPWYHTLAVQGYLDSPEVAECPASDIVSSFGKSAGPDEEPPDAVKTIDKVLRWLRHKQHRLPSESFADGHGSWEKSPGAWETLASKPITALALATFIGAGKTDADEEFGETVRLAVEYLTSPYAQHKSHGPGSSSGQPLESVKGLFKRRSGNCDFYGQGICTMVLAETSNFLVDAELRAKARSSAQMGLDCIFREHLDGGWFNYGGKHTYTKSGGSTRTRYDNSVSVWCYQAMGLARRAGFSIPQDDLNKANNWLYEAMNRKEGHRNYGSSAYMHPGGSGNPRLSAAVLYCRRLFGQPADSRDCRAQAEFVRDHLYRYCTGHSGHKHGDDKFIYGLYYATLAFREMGDLPDRRYWSEWSLGRSGVSGWEEGVVGRLINDELPVSAGKDSEGNEMAYWPKTISEYLNEQNNYESLRRDVFATCLAALAVEVAMAHELPGSKFARPGAHSYGYNSLVGDSLLRPAANTIILLDYTNSAVNPGDFASEKLAPRHNDRMNVLFGDGRVEPRYPEEITSEEDRIYHRLLTPAPDD